MSRVLITGATGYIGGRLVPEPLAAGHSVRCPARHPGRLQTGESVDFWRVEEIIPGRLLRLRAEMRRPGLAWLELTHGVVFGGMLRNIVRAAEAG